MFLSPYAPTLRFQYSECQHTFAKIILFLQINKMHHAKCLIVCPHTNTSNNVKKTSIHYELITLPWDCSRTSDEYKSRRRVKVGKQRMSQNDTAAIICNIELVKCYTFHFLKN